MHITPTDMLEAAEALTPKQALAERERLRGQLATLRATADEATARSREIKAEVKVIETELAVQRMEAVRKGERISQSQARQKLLEIEVETEDMAATIEAARVMRQKTETDLHYLQVQQFEAFAEYAESRGEKAAEALEALRPGYEKAVELWGEAQSEWNVLARAHNEGRGGGPAPTIRPDGSVRTSEDAPPPLSKAPECPLPPVAEVFGVDPPRPPELQVDPD